MKKRGRCRTPGKDVYRYLAMMKECGHKRELGKAQELHEEIRRSGFLEDAFITSGLIGMYAKCGSMERAHQVLRSRCHSQDEDEEEEEEEEDDDDDVVPWNALIGGYAKQGIGIEALHCFDEMRERKKAPNAVTFVLVLKACAMAKDPWRAHELHAEVKKKGMDESSAAICSSLVAVHAACGSLSAARAVFDKLSIRDAYAWNALIGGCIDRGFEEEALELFDAMRSSFVAADAVSYVHAMKACASLGASHKGREIHEEMLLRCHHRHGSDLLILSNSVVEMYANCGMLGRAKEAFDAMPIRDVVSWTSLMGGFLRCRLPNEALRCLESMQARGEGIAPDAAAFVCGLKACQMMVMMMMMMMMLEGGGGGGGVEEKGGYVHGEIVKRGLETELLVGNALVDLYARRGLVEIARALLRRMPRTDIVSWTGLIGGYVEHGRCEEALDCIAELRGEKLRIAPNACTLVLGLKACGESGAEERGRQIHAEIAAKALGDSAERPSSPGLATMMIECPFLGSALVDMYSSLGLLVDASYVFDRLCWNHRDDVSYTAIIAGFSLLGDVRGAAGMLRKMEDEGIAANRVTFQSLLNACSHAGLPDCGYECLAAMMSDRAQQQQHLGIEHCVSALDLLGRAGQIEAMSRMIDAMPFHPNRVTWHAVLGACRRSGDVASGIAAFRHAVEMGGFDEGAYLSMFNIYADARMHAQARGIDESMRRSKAAR